MCFQPTLPGKLQLREGIEHWLVIHLACEGNTTVFGLVFGMWTCDQGEYWGDMWWEAVRILTTTTAWAHPKGKQSGSAQLLGLLCAIQHGVLQQAGAGAQVLCHLLFRLARTEEIHPGSPCWSKTEHSAVLEGGQPKRLCREGPLFSYGMGSKEWGILEKCWSVLLPGFHWRETGCSSWLI